VQVKTFMLLIKFFFFYLVINKSWKMYHGFYKNIIVIFFLLY